MQLCRLMFLIPMAAAILALAGPGHVSGGDHLEQPEPIRVGVSLALTGPYAPMALMQKRGYELWARHVGEDGGILGRPVEMIILDDRGDPERALDIYTTFLDRDDMDFLMGPYTSSLTEAVAPLTNAAEQPMLAAGAASDTLWEKGYEWVYGVYAPASRYGLGFIELLVAGGIESTAIVHGPGTFSRSMARGTGQWCEHLAIDVVHESTAGADLEGMRAVARAARESGAQSLIVCGYWEEAVRFRRALDDIGWRPRAFFASVGPVIPEYRTELGELAESVFTSAQWHYHPRLKYAGSTRFRDDFLDEWDVEPTYQAATAYAAGQVLARAIETVKSTEPGDVRRALSTFETFTIIGRYRVDRTGKQTGIFPVVLQWIDGVLTPVWPPEMSETEARFDALAD
jgi:branched-chain amino acid transport system substrate-binding protein